MSKKLKGLFLAAFALVVVAGIAWAAAITTSDVAVFPSGSAVVGSGRTISVDVTSNDGRVVSVSLLKGTKSDDLTASLDTKPASVAKGTYAAFIVTPDVAGLVNYVVVTWSGSSMLSQDNNVAVKISTEPTFTPGPKTFDAPGSITVVTSGTKFGTFAVSVDGSSGDSKTKGGITVAADSKDGKITVSGTSTTDVAFSFDVITAIAASGSVVDAYTVPIKQYAVKIAGSSSGDVNIKKGTIVATPTSVSGDGVFVVAVANAVSLDSKTRVDALPSTVSTAAKDVLKGYLDAAAAGSSAMKTFVNNALRSIGKEVDGTHLGELVGFNVTLPIATPANSVAAVTNSIDLTAFGTVDNVKIVKITAAGTGIEFERVSKTKMKNRTFAILNADDSDASGNLSGFYKVVVGIQDNGDCDYDTAGNQVTDPVVMTQTKNIGVGDTTWTAATFTESALASLRAMFATGVDGTKAIVVNTGSGTVVANPGYLTDEAAKVLKVHKGAGYVALPVFGSFNAAANSTGTLHWDIAQLPNSDLTKLVIVTIDHDGVCHVLSYVPTAPVTENTFTIVKDTVAGKYKITYHIRDLVAGGSSVADINNVANSVVVASFLASAEDLRSPSSSGGCSAFAFAPLALLVLAPLAVRRIRK